MSLIGRSTGNRSLISDNTFKNDLPKYKKYFIEICKTILINMLYIII